MSPIQIRSGTTEICRHARSRPEHTATNCSTVDWPGVKNSTRSFYSPETGSKKDNEWI